MWFPFQATDPTKIRNLSLGGVYLFHFLRKSFWVFVLM